MTQRPIDLLPESVMLSCQAGLRTGRYVAAVVAAVIIVVVLATHSRIEHERARERLVEARQTADLVLQTEARAAGLKQHLDDAERAIALHDRIAFPMRIGSLLATMINRLPASVSLDRLDLNTSARAPQRAARTQGKGSADSPPPSRFLSGEISGFAASDADIIGILEALSAMHPYDDITLDFTRTRTVRGHPSREFRISFRVNLDSAYEDLEVAAASVEQAAGGVQ